MEREGIASPELASPDFFTPEEISEHDFVALLSSEQRELLTTLRSVLNAAQEADSKVLVPYFLRRASLMVDVLVGASSTAVDANALRTKLQEHIELTQPPNLSNNERDGSVEAKEEEDGKRSPSMRPVERSASDGFLRDREDTGERLTRTEHEYLLAVRRAEVAEKKLHNAQRLIEELQASHYKHEFDRSRTLSPQQSRNVRSPPRSGAGANRRLSSYDTIKAAGSVKRARRKSAIMFQRISLFDGMGETEDGHSGVSIVCQGVLSFKDNTHAWKRRCVQVMEMVDEERRVQRSVLLHQKETISNRPKEIPLLELKGVRMEDGDRSFCFVLEVNDEEEVWLAADSDGDRTMWMKLLLDSIGPQLDSTRTHLRDNSDSRQKDQDNTKMSTSPTAGAGSSSEELSWFEKKRINLHKPKKSRDLKDINIKRTDVKEEFGAPRGDTALETVADESDLRQKALQEIISSERAYLNHLRVLVDVYKKPVMMSGIISTNDIQQLFSNVDSILSAHELIGTKLDQLESAAPAPTPSMSSPSVSECDSPSMDADLKSVGKLFLDVIPFLLIYAQFVQEYPKSVEAHGRLKKKKAFAALLDKCKAENGVQDLVSYLIMPVQRIPRYVLLLQELMKHVDESEEEYKLLDQAVDKVKELADTINEAKERADNMAKCVEIYGNFVDRDEWVLINPSRRWIRDGPLKIIGDNERLPRDVHCFLFSDLLLIAKRKKRQFEREISVQLSHAVMREGEDDQKALLMFPNCNEGITIIASDVEERDSWLKDVETQISRVLKEPVMFDTVEDSLKLTTKQGFLRLLVSGLGESVLEKSGSSSAISKAAKKRFIRLKGASLFSYANESDGAVKRCFSVSEATLQVDVSQGYSFLLSYSDKSVVRLTADGADDFADWLKVLRPLVKEEAHMSLNMIMGEGRNEHCASGSGVRSRKRGNSATSGHQLSHTSPPHSPPHSPRTANSFRSTICFGVKSPVDGVRTGGNRLRRSASLESISSAVTQAAMQKDDGIVQEVEKKGPEKQQKTCETSANTPHKQRTGNADASDGVEIVTEGDEVGEEESNDRAEKRRAKESVDATKPRWNTSTSGHRFKRQGIAILSGARSLAKSSVEKEKESSEGGGGSTIVGLASPFGSRRSRKEKEKEKEAVESASPFPGIRLRE